MTKPALRTALMGASALTASVLVMAVAGQAAAQQVNIGHAAGSNETRNVGAGQTLSGSQVVVGWFGTGTLNVTDGGVTTSAAIFALGGEASGQGTVNVSGAGSRIDAGSLLGVGLWGRGTLSVSDGATAGGGSVAIGRNTASNGSATVTGAGSSIASRTWFTVGHLGHGELTVSNGAGVSSDADFQIGAGSSSTGVVTVTGAGSTLTAGRDLLVGDAGEGRLVVSAGGIAGATREVVIGNAVGSTGAVTVTGAGSSLTAGTVLRVGNRGVGELTVSNGATTNASSDIQIGVLNGVAGVVTVTGAGSTLTTGRDLIVGDAGEGRLVVSDGGIAGATRDVIIGNAVGSTGVVTVTGAGSSLTAGNQLRVGNRGVGELTVSDGAAVSAQSGVNIGAYATGQGLVTVTGAGSSLTSSSWIYVGEQGRGELTVSNGATVTSGGPFRVAVQQGAEGFVSVSGAGSSLTTGGMTIGTRGRGELTVSDGAAVTSSNDIIAGTDANSEGAINVTGAGSSLTSTGGRLTVGLSGRGEMTVSGGGAVISERLTIGQGNTGVGTLTLTGAGSTLTNSSWIEVGTTGSGVITITDGARLNAGGAVYLSSLASGRGVLNVTGAGSSFSTSGNILVGTYGTGLLNVSDGATVNAQTGLSVAREAGSTGVVTVGGASGSAATGAGVVNGDITFGAGDGLLVFNHDTAGYAYTGAIGGTTAGVGRIRFEAGRTRFNTTDNGFTGVSDIYSGAALHLNGALMGTLNVLAGGELSGVGAIGDLNVDGVVRMGGDSAIGTLTGTSANFNAGSVFVVDVAGRMADTLVLSGAANIASGSILRAVVNSGAVYTAGARSVILSAAGGLTGQFTLEGGPRALTNFLSLRDGYSATEAYLEVALVRDFATAGVTANQRAAGAGAQSLGAGALFNAIANMPNDAAAQVAFDALSGELHPGVRGVMARDGYRLQQVVVRNSLDGEREAGARVWGEAWSSNGRTDGDGNAERLDHDSVGFLAGADTHVGGGWRLGAALGYDQGDVSSDRGSGTADLKRRSILVYVDGWLGGWDLRGGLGYTDVSVDTRRLVAFASPAGNFSEALAADYDGSVTHAYIDAGYPIAVGDAHVAPFVNLSRVSVDTDAFSERTGLAALNVNQASADLTFSTLGLRAGGVAFAGAELSGSAGWRHASGDRDTVGVHAFAGGSGFQVRSVETARSAAVIDLDAQWTPASNLKLGAGVSYVGGSDQSDFGARLSLRYSF